MASQANIRTEAARDSVWLIRTGPDKALISDDDVVRSLKQLTQVEHTFRSKTSMAKHVWPVHQHVEGRVRAHIFLRMLAFFAPWHMVDAWCELWFVNEDQAGGITRAPRRRSDRQGPVITVPEFTAISNLTG